MCGCREHHPEIGCREEGCHCHDEPTDTMPDFEELFEGHIPVTLGNMEGKLIGKVSGLKVGDEVHLHIVLTGKSKDDMVKVMESDMPLGLNFSMMPRKDFKKFHEDLNILINDPGNPKNRG